MKTRRSILLTIGAIGAAGAAGYAMKMKAPFAGDKDSPNDMRVKMPDTQESTEIEKLNLSESEWQDRLTPEEFHILREEGTEPRNSSPLLHEKREGTFVCAGCELPLFKSDMKYESGTGWPSFFDVIPGHVETREDRKFFMVRTEYHCARCGGHQGHVFDDGPKPTGLRYCNNGLALDFVPAEDGAE